MNFRRCQSRFRLALLRSLGILLQLPSFLESKSGRSVRGCIDTDSDPQGFIYYSRRLCRVLKKKTYAHQCAYPWTSALPDSSSNVFFPMLAISCGVLVLSQTFLLGRKIHMPFIQGHCELSTNCNTIRNAMLHFLRCLEKKPFLSDLLLPLGTRGHG